MNTTKKQTFVRCKTTFYGSSRFGESFPLLYSKKDRYAAVLIDNIPTKLNWTTFTQRFTLI